VNAGASAALPVSVAGFDADDTVTVTIGGLTSYETITDTLDKKTFSGSSVTLTAAEVNSGLSLQSSYGGTDHPVNTLTITASNTTAGESATSAPQTITGENPRPPRLRRSPSQILRWLLRPLGETGISTTPHFSIWQP
jgi:hypothetical protein